MLPHCPTNARHRAKPPHSLKMCRPCTRKQLAATKKAHSLWLCVYLSPGVHCCGRPPAHVRPPRLRDDTASFIQPWGYRAASFRRLCLLPPVVRLTRGRRGQPAQRANKNERQLMIQWQVLSEPVVCFAAVGKGVVYGGGMERGVSRQIAAVRYCSALWTTERLYMPQPVGVDIPQGTWRQRLQIPRKPQGEHGIRDRAIFP